ncbi:MAG: RsmD family RNA methyltransferase [Gemmatimonadota bacterium]|nr:RsmD family RNA methyltransferase [Gemmatimonadota bacterium]
MRPTADRVREAWMSIIQDALDGATVLDLFAGSGALGFEALSRGARQVDFVEIAPRSLAALRENAAALAAGSAAVIRRGDALRFIERLPPSSYDIAFADPPYRLGLAARVAERWLATPFARVIGIEHEARETLADRGEVRRYGDTAITFYRATDMPSQPHA